MGIHVIDSVYFGDLHYGKIHATHGDYYIINLSHSYLSGDNVVNFPLNDHIMENNETYEKYITYIMHLITLTFNYSLTHKVIICCRKGINRSALIAAAYLILCHSMAPNNAISHLRVKNRLNGKVCLTNTSFVHLLGSLPHTYTNSAEEITNLIKHRVNCT